VHAKVNDMQCKGTKSKASLSTTKSLTYLLLNYSISIEGSYEVTRELSGADKLLDGFVDRP